ncbi:unnamed protein product [Thelazia callipaeda]|uniref:Vesicular, overexpressed in cancer, prosurvival protein 1 n=1 Tax=Thelazia callipaeda TaxID=103827 RepID=A0A0N5D334_THECL|nr:unnamed protein product [Thelazia callipaeda]
MDWLIIAILMATLYACFISLYCLYYFLKYLLERGTYNQFIDMARNESTHNLDTVCYPLNTISYPPSSPPVYECTGDHVNTRSSRVNVGFNRNDTNPPQYTDFRAAVYAEPPPYSEKY